MSERKHDKTNGISSCLNEKKNETTGFSLGLNGNTIKPSVFQHFKHFIQALYPKHFIQALYQTIWSQHFIQSLDQTTLQKHFTQALYQGMLKSVLEIPVKVLQRY